MNNNLTDFWGKRAKDKLEGKTIAEVRYMNDQEMINFGWTKKPLIIWFTDGSYIIPITDGEANEAGAIMTSFKGDESFEAISNVFMDNIDIINDQN